MRTVNLSVRLDASLKSEVETCLNELGMNMSTAITIYLKQIVRRRAIPFPVSIDLVPNAETIEAIKEGERIARDPNVKGYRDMKKLVEALNS